MNALLRRLGIDAGQWKALTTAYLLMDLRRGGGARRVRASNSDTGNWAVAGLLVGAFINSILIALLVLVIHDTLTAAVQMVLMVSITVAMLLVIDFTGSVLSAEDYWIVGPRPVGSRTYFSARVSAVLAYVIAVAVVMSLLPSLAFLISHGIGFTGFAGAMAAAVLASCTGASVVIGACIFLMTRVHPTRLVRGVSIVHLMGSAVPLGGYLLVMRGFQDAVLRDFSIGLYWWIWYLPVTWYASIVPLAGGVAGAHEAAAAGAAFLLTGLAIALASGGFTIDTAARLAEVSGSATPAKRSRGLLERLPGLSEGEPYVVTTLLAAQFRNDLRFRLAVLGVIPLMVFYMILGWDGGAGSDPFAGRPTRTNAAIYMGIALVPMILHNALQYSDSWRAAWLFWASPCDRVRLLLAAKNFVAIVFIGAYTLLLAILWSLTFDRVWHALVHAVVVGSLAHVGLQVALITNPSVPFAREPRRADQTSRIFALLFFSITLTSSAPFLLPYAYRHMWSTVVLVLLLAVATAVLEWLAHRRVRTLIDDTEWA